ncbi:putative F-box domain-containing protein [Helianthus annuus]|nr:putative F-box domain-containing protein [Helianthus annuus]
MLDMEDSDHQSIQSGAIIGSNDDLITEILLRLPAVSILRFKSVSKHWRWLLRQKHFTQRYDNVSKSPTGLIATDKYVPFDVENPSVPPFRCLDSYFDRPGVEIVQSCNGLLLCVTRPKGRNGVNKHYVFNPTTKQLALIPSIPGGPKTILYMGLAFHQTDCVHFQVICVCYVDPYQIQIQIYSSDARKWKISIQSFHLPVRFTHPGVYWNGAIYWAPYYGNSNCLYFKLDVQQLQRLPLPEGLMTSITLMYFGESRGHLHLIADKNRSLSVYEMLSNHSGWFLKYQLQFDALGASFPGTISQVMDVVRGKEEEEDTFLVLKTPEKIITYNVHDTSFKQIYSLSKDCRSIFYRYTETLSSF